ncbi:MAG TPA: hypothetical protein VLD37_04720 [Candidatus Bilamarchaeum sp.]|nr:hypothetical protein [Candidatus Bilamarchaeum sp.]
MNFERIRRIHILVHPGFSADPLFSSEPSLAEKCRLLFRRYEEKAGAMGGDELMVALTHSGRREFMDDVAGGAGYAEWLLGMRRTLGKRLIVLCNDMADSPAPARLALRIAKARGFSVSRWVRCEAYGEMLGECVDRAAEAFNRSARLHRKSEIDISATDFGLFFDSTGPENIGKHVSDARTLFPRLTYRHGPADK